MTYSEQVLAYEAGIRNAVLQTSSIAEVRMDLPVASGLEGAVLRALEALRTGAKVHPDKEGRALQDAVASLVDEYEKNIVARQHKRAEDAGVRLSLAGALTQMERDAVRAFVLWVIVRASEAERTGARQKRLEAAAQAMGVQDEANRDLGDHGDRFVAPA